jgi:uncharacterized protein
LLPLSSHFRAGFLIAFTQIKIMITLFIVGASGRVGSHLTRLALDKGFAVHALMRDPSALKISHPNLSVMKGDITQSGTAEAFLNGSGIVISAVGDRNLNEEITVISETMKRLAPVMAANGIKRVLGISGAGILQHDKNSLLRDQIGFPPFLLNVSKDHMRVFEHLSVTQLDWTLVCPPQIIDAPPSGEYQTMKNYFPAGTNRICAGDIADFILNEIQLNQFIRCRVGITN